jgi:hypothetical protein
MTYAALIRTAPNPNNYFQHARKLEFNDRELYVQFLKARFIYN